VLKVISRSAFDHNGVGHADTIGGRTLRRDGGSSIRKAATLLRHGFADYGEEFIRIFKNHAAAIGPGHGWRARLLTGEVQTSPIFERTDYDPAWRRSSDMTRCSASPACDTTIVGAIVLARRGVGGILTPVELVQTFADQAVIAIETCAC